MDYGFGYWPPFYDPTAPNTAEGRPPFVLRPVTTIVNNYMIASIMMPVPCYYL